MKSPRLLVAFITISSLATTSLMADNLLPQGDFGSGVLGALPEGWSGHQSPHLDRVDGAHKIAEENGETFLRLEKADAASVLKVDTVQDLSAGTKEITLTITDRVIDIVPGSDKPNRDVFRVGVNFLNAQDEIIKEGTPQIARERPFAEWKTDFVRYDVPEGTAKVSVSLMLLQCTGIWEVQTIELATD